MRVGIDASYLLTAEKSGVETYALNLVRGLLGLEERPECFLYAASSEPAGEDTDGIWDLADKVRISRHTRLWLRARMPILMALDRVDIAHFPGSLLPLWLPAPAVVTFYDLAALRYPELYDPRELSYYDSIIPRAARRAAAVIAISQATKADVVQAFGIPESKVHVTPLGVDRRFVHVPDAGDLVRREYGLEPGYVLGCVGSGHPRKNLSAVVKAFDLLAPDGPQLAIVGAVARDPEALRAFEASPGRHRIHLIGHVHENTLPAIYSAARVLCFPSLFEGCGLPVLEAMACGTPVVCSNVSSLPEVAGDAALLVDPREIEAIAEALARLLTDDALHEDLSKRGLERAGMYTWERTARLTVEAYHAAAG
ncbi:MAG: glycosyltransferase family 4 protein [Armatimonadetes bacterium]|nr:glycosyltransferase family 4 protein [Armatimonadota bacterium]